MLFFLKEYCVVTYCSTWILDPKTLNAKYTQSQVKNGSSDTELALAEIVEELIKGISSKMKLLYGCDTANGSSNLNQYDGYVKIINGLLLCDNYNCCKLYCC
jgi:hypothetical protein